MTIDPARAAAIKLVSFDVDGVLTDGSLWIATTPDGPPSELRRFHVLDGMATRLLQQVGIAVAFLSSKRSTAVEARAEELSIDFVSLGAREGKVSALAGMLSSRGWSFGEVAHLADDLADIAVMERVGLPGAVVNAVPEIRARASWTGTVPGGSGAAREFVEALLKARGEWDDLVSEFREGGRFAGRPVERMPDEGAGENAP